MRYKTKCAFEALKDKEVDYLIHCCNAQGVMGSGFAKTVKEQYPEAYKTYIEHDLVLGSFTQADGIINAIAQEYYGKSKGRRYLSYDALTDCLQSIADALPTGTRVGLPYLVGCDRAGGEWAVVEQIIRTTLAKRCIVTIYRLK